LLAIAQESKPFIIFDSFVRFHNEDENDASAMSRPMGKFRKLADAGATVLFIHHRSKSGETKYRGSSDIAAGVDCGLSLEPTEDGLLKLHRFKSRFGPELWLDIRPDFERGTFELTQSPERLKRDEDAELVAEQITLHPGICQRELSQNLAGMITYRQLRSILQRHQGSKWNAVPNGHGKPTQYFAIGRSAPVLHPKGCVAPTHLTVPTAPEVLRSSEAPHVRPQ
jgi:hypothetical protein